MEKKTEEFSIKKRLKSFQYAFDGFKVLLKHEHNARVHLMITVLIVIIGFVTKLKASEWLFIVFAIGFVFTAEIFNTCIEEICDFICTEQNSKIKKIKDLAALAVLFSALTSVVIGLGIFLPKLIALF